MPEGNQICPYRYLLRGRSFCSLAIVESRFTVSEVIPPTCAECPVPGVLAEHACGRMDLGVEISVYGGLPAVGMHYASCEVTVERLTDVTDCSETDCPYWEPFDEEEARRTVEEVRRHQLERQS